MMLGFIAAGAKGIIGYTYLGLPSNPALWNELGSIAAEVKTIAATLLKGAIERLTTRDADVFATTWTIDNESLLILGNTSYDQSKTVALDLAKQPKALAPAFAGRPGGLDAGTSPSDAGAGAAGGAKAGHVLAGLRDAT